MEAFAYEPTDSDVEALAKMQDSPGWLVFLAIMKLAYNETAIEAIEEMAGGDARPVGYYKGFMDSLKQTVARIDSLVDTLKAKREAENAAARAAPVLRSTGVGSTI